MKADDVGYASCTYCGGNELDRRVHVEKTVDMGSELYAVVIELPMMLACVWLHGSFSWRA